METEANSLVGSIADRIAIAAPCKASWDKMQGDDTKRFCGDCSKHVYNLSAMTKFDAEELLLKADQMPCLRFYRRQDGTIIFENCPKGLRRIRDAAKSALRITSLAFAFVLSIVSCFAKDEKLESPSNFNLVWTLSENGPATSYTNIQIPAKQPPVAQLGSVDRYTYLNHLFSRSEHTKGVGADWEGSDAVSRAFKLVEKKKYSRAAIAFEEALSACSKPNSDPMYKEFIGIEYSKLLTKMGKIEKAQAIKAETKMSRAGS